MSGLVFKLDQHDQAGSLKERLEQQQPEQQQQQNANNETLDFIINSQLGFNTERVFPQHKQRKERGKQKPVDVPD